MSNCIKFYWQSQGVLKQIQKVSSSAWQITGSFKLRLVRAQTQLKLSSSAEIHSISNTVPRGQFHKSWTHGANHRDSSIHLRPLSTPNFWEAFYWRKCSEHGAKQCMQSTPGSCHLYKVLQKHNRRIYCYRLAMFWMLA